MSNPSPELPLERIDESKINLDSLAQNCESRRIVPFVGAGMSAAFEFPTWKGFLIETAKAENLSDGFHWFWRALGHNDPQDRMRLTHPDQSNPVEAAARLEELIGSEKLRKSIQTTFGPPPSVTGSEPVIKLRELSPDLVITTNYDSVLESLVFPNAKVVDGVDPLQVYDAIAYSDRGKVTIVKLHGTARTPDSCILTPADYLTAYDCQSSDLPLPTIGHALRLLLLTRPILFLGASLLADRACWLAHELQKEGHEITAFAVVPWAQNDGKRFAQSLEDCGIKPIWYPSKDYPARDQLLQAVCQCCSPKEPMRAIKVTGSKLRAVLVIGQSKLLETGALLPSPIKVSSKLKDKNGLSVRPCEGATSANAPHHIALEFDSNYESALTDLPLIIDSICDGFGPDQVKHWCLGAALEDVSENVPHTEAIEIARLLATAQLGFPAGPARRIFVGVREPTRLRLGTSNSAIQPLSASWWNLKKEEPRPISFNLQAEVLLPKFLTFAPERLAGWWCVMLGVEEAFGRLRRVWVSQETTGTELDVYPTLLSKVSDFPKVVGLLQLKKHSFRRGCQVLADPALTFSHDLFFSGTHNIPDDELAVPRTWLWFPNNDPGARSWRIRLSRRWPRMITLWPGQIDVPDRLREHIAPGAQWKFLSFARFRWSLPDASSEQQSGNSEANDLATHDYNSIEYR